MICFVKKSGLLMMFAVSIIMVLLKDLFFSISHLELCCFNGNENTDTLCAEFAGQARSGPF